MTMVAMLILFSLCQLKIKTFRLKQNAKITQQ